MSPANIMNYDETNISDDAGQQRVLVNRGLKRARRFIDSSKSSISVMLNGAADRSLLPPCVVYKAVHLYPEWILRGPPGTRYIR